MAPGDKVGNWIILSERFGSRKHPRVKARCVCGKEKDVLIGHLKSGVSTSCGCMRSTTHGHAKSNRERSPTYNTWLGMKERCLNPNHQSYPVYGGRGITLCDRWLKFENFLEDMGERPEGKTLDRKDNDKGYTKSNCRWATKEEQYDNQNGAIEHNGEKHSIKGWAEKLNIPYARLQARLHRGWEFERAISTPAMVVTHNSTLKKKAKKKCG